MNKKLKECPKCGYFMQPMYEYGKDSDAYVYMCTKCFNVVGKSILDRLKEAIKEIEELLNQDEEQIDFVKGFDPGLERALYYIEGHFPELKEVKDENNKNNIG